MKTTRLRISLHEVTPVVLRVIDVPDELTLAELHPVLQAALGWTDSHLHEYTAGARRYGVPEPDVPAGRIDEATAGLADLPSRFSYLYDPGDGWSHDVRVLGPGGQRPGCVYGEGDCPPEDCGGPPGYAELRRILADATHAEHDRVRRWLGTRPEFDQASADTRVRWSVGEVPASVRLLLDLAADGVRLTPGGRLPRALVRQVQQHYPHWHPMGKPAHLEDDLPPLAALHDLLRKVGLLRLRKGSVYPTRAAGDDLAVVRRIRSAFHPAVFGTELARLAVAILAATGPQPLERLAETIHPLLDTRWVHTDGRPLTGRDIWRTLAGLSPVLVGLDQIVDTWPALDAGPAARSLLPGTAILPDLLSLPAGA